MNGHFSCVAAQSDSAFAITTPRLSIHTSMQSPTLSKSVDYRPCIVVTYERRDIGNNHSDGKFLIETHVTKLDALNKKLFVAEDDGYESLEKAFDEIYAWSN